MAKPEMGDTVRVRDYRGVAFLFLGYGSREIVEPDTDVFYYEPNYDRAKVAMVGDDRVFEVDFDAMTALAPEDFCADCGQIGCSHGRHT